jgi:hypothetical protein
VLDAIHRYFIQNKADWQRSIDTHLELIALHIDVDLFDLLTDRTAKSADVIGKLDGLAFLLGCKLIMCKGDGVNTARNVIKRAMNLRLWVPALLL